MKATIGAIAERVRTTLKTHGPQTLPALCEVLEGVSPVEVVMALGWLVHEDQVVFGSRSMSLRVMLRGPSPTDAPRSGDPVV